LTENKLEETTSDRNELEERTGNNLLLLTLIDAGSGWFQNVTAATGLVQDNVRM
jgi:hypothetical protein